MEWSKKTYNDQYEKWMPWIEDTYLSWFTKDNKTSYAAKQNLDKSKVTGVSQVDTLQDGVNNLAAGQVGQGGLLEPAGKLASKEGVNRAERQGKDNNGGYVDESAPGGSAVNAAGKGVADSGQAVASGGSAVAGKLGDGVKGAGGYVGGMFGGKNEGEEKK